MARWHSCNIFQGGADTRRVWAFDAHKADLGVAREQAVAAGQSLPGGLVNKSWASLWQPKLNVAWLEVENVFLRVIQLPKADLAETRAMIEFQLEKLSPIPVTQLVWSIHCLPHPVVEKIVVEGEKTKEDLQTVIVVMTTRAVVENVLGQLEKDGFLADRLEVPLLDQLQNAATNGDGAWVYLEAGRKTALVAWWFGGVLQSLGLVYLPADKNAAVLREQLVQMTWAGELEGWLAAAPRWHVVAAGSIASEWQAAFAAALETPVKTAAPLAPAALAQATARRVTQADSSANILPEEFSKRYQQQFVDRLWLRGLGAVIGLYVAGLVVYFVALGILVHQANGIQQQVADISQNYTNAIQLKARYLVLKDRQDLKFAALECWKATAEVLPQGTTLNGFDFRDGKKILLTGSAPAEQAVELTHFSDALRRAEVNGQLLFSHVDSPTYNQNPGNNTLSWNFACELNHSEDSAP